MFIAFEGPDGSGKTTLIENILPQLNGAGIPVQVYREPGGTEVGEEIRSVLKSDSRKAPLTSLLLFTAARYQLISSLPDMNTPDMLYLFDRYVPSSIIYQSDAHNDDPILYTASIAARWLPTPHCIVFCNRIGDKAADDSFSGKDQLRIINHYQRLFPADNPNILTLTYGNERVWASQALEFIVERYTAYRSTYGKN